MEIELLFCGVFHPQRLGVGFRPAGAMQALSGLLCLLFILVLWTEKNRTFYSITIIALPC
jgi:hypothetical protein